MAGSDTGTPNPPGFLSPMAWTAARPPSPLIALMPPQVTPLMSARAFLAFFP